ncbi:parallel beta-helix repeat protein [Salinibacterium sp. CAN_S4]|uniref:right-handed parallel beta-helix repeat-containing protein n=1 Tax=Salinibacterium sp. CAN_S4 TaxID=2787727 RepID=UPI0018F031C4
MTLSPTSIPRAHPRRVAGVSAVILAALLTISGCASTGSAPAPVGRSVVEVPGDAATISEAIEAVSPGGLVLVSPGTYLESVTVDKDDVTVRGTDRNSVVIDGEGLRPNGIQVIADGVRVQNLTVTNHTFNGVLVTGLHDANGAQAHSLDGYTTLDPEKFPPLQRFEVSNVTASNNGLYGIYAFNSQHGVIRDNYASGSADSGYYVGQCANCDILVTGNVAEHNAIGYENANASDSVLVAANRFSDNRVGLTLLSWYQEAYLPQRAATVVGNVIADNASGDSPAQANGAFGVGIGLSGANQNVIERNLIADNPSSGVQLTNTEDLSSEGNRLIDNVFESNGVDVADLSAPRAPASDNCVSPTDTVSFLPAGLAAACGSTSVSGSRAQLPALDVPRGVSFLKIAAGPRQLGMAGDVRDVPAALPGTVTFPELDTIAVPDRSFLEELTRG